MVACCLVPLGLEQTKNDSTIQDSSPERSRYTNPS
jgi:hypothetical protein